jgi:hypothetical protein
MSSLSQFSCVIPGLKLDIWSQQGYLRHGSAGTLFPLPFSHCLVISNFSYPVSGTGDTFSISLLLFYIFITFLSNSHSSTMLTSKLLATLLLATVLLILGAHAQIQVPPTNLTTGFVRFPNGTSQVTWFYTPTGLVAYDGDAIFGTVAEFKEALVNITYTSGGTDNSTNSTAIYRRSYPPAVKRVTKRSDSRWPGSANLWPSGKVYYRYWDDNTESQLSQYIDGAIASWANAVPCISFVKLPNDNDPAGSNGIVTVVAHNPNVGYCLASQIGYGLNSLWMSLDTGGGCGVPEVTHEWGKCNPI